MKYTERPGWMAPSRRSPAQRNKIVSVKGQAAGPRGVSPEASQGANAPAQAEPPAQPPKALTEQGYDPYDTVKTRTLDIWRFKTKRD